MLIFGGEQPEVRILDITTNCVEFMKKKQGMLKGMLSKDNNLKMGGNGYFYNQMNISQGNIILLERECIYLVNLKESKCNAVNYFGVKYT